MTDSEYQEALDLAKAFCTPRALCKITKQKIEKALDDYGCGENGWGDLFEYEQTRIVVRAAGGN